MRKFFAKSKILQPFRNKYIVTLGAFVIWIAFIDDSNLISQYKRGKELGTILEKKGFYEEQIAMLRENISRIDNEEMMERFAREQYRMKKKNEDIFIFEEDVPKE